jgi:hypothetical protein
MADNRLFEEHSWYFRNALVRANYKNVAKGISQDSHFLELFFRNLLMGETNELKNRYLLVNPPEEWKQPASTGQAQDKYGTSVEGSPKDHRRIVEESPNKHRTSTGYVAHGQSQYSKPDMCGWRAGTVGERNDVRHRT